MGNNEKNQIKMYHKEIRINWKFEKIWNELSEESFQNCIDSMLRKFQCALKTKEHILIINF